MTHYIDKDRIVAEINRVLNSYDPNEITSGRYALVNLRDFLDTLEVIEIGVDLGDSKGDKSAKYIIDTKNLEVKDVDLHKEIKDYFDNQPIVTRSGGIDYQLIPSAETIAKHFFELGLKAQKGE